MCGLSKFILETSLEGLVKHCKQFSLGHLILILSDGPQPYFVSLRNTLFSFMAQSLRFGQILRND